MTTPRRSASAVAEHRSCPPEVLELLAGGNDNGVRSAVEKVRSIAREHGEDLPFEQWAILMAMDA